MRLLLFCFGLLLCLSACKKDEVLPPGDAQIHFQFAFDKDQVRLNNLGQESSIPAGHAAQSPDFNSMSVHYIEFVPSQLTPIGDGAIVYEGQTQAAEAGSNFDQAIIWDQAILSGADSNFLTISLDQLPPGTYEYLRASVTYQNANIRFNLLNLPAPLPANLLNQQGTLAGFIGFNTHIKEHTVFNQSQMVNADKVQGFWAFEPQFEVPFQSLYLQFVNPAGVESGQAPEGSTTVVNPLSAFGIEIPQGSCIVTGQLTEPLVITGEETTDITVQLSFSVNNSFEWVDQNANGEWDLDVNGAALETPVDMGLRGLIVKVSK